MRKHVWFKNRQSFSFTEYVKKSNRQVSIMKLLSTVLDYKSKLNNYALLSYLIFCTVQTCGISVVL